MKTTMISIGMLSLFALVASPALATELGDPAPALKIREWIKGDAVELAKGKGEATYVVEFWATWCPPCRKSIPHLTELQGKYRDKGVIFVGISDETPETVKEFMKTWDKKMEYVVAIDDEEKSTGKAYMEAFGIAGIPHAFIVNKDGAIAWHGHPMEMDEPLEAIVAGKYDLESAKKAEKERLVRAKRVSEARELLPKYFQAVSESKDAAAGASEMGQKIVTLLEGESQFLNMFAWTVLTDERIVSRDFPLALKAAKSACEATGWKNAAILDTYALALFETGDVDGAIEWEKKAIAACEDDQLKPELEKALKKFEDAKNKK